MTASAADQEPARAAQLDISRLSCVKSQKALAPQLPSHNGRKRVQAHLRAGVVTATASLAARQLSRVVATTTY